MHLPALLARPDVEVVAVAAGSTESAARFDAGSIPVGASWQAALEHDLDAVVLALPPDVNEAAAAAALARGLAVFSEKPLACTSATAHRLAAAAAGSTTMVDFELAEIGPFASLVELIRQGALGTIQEVDITWLMLSRAMEARRWSWKTDAARGGGVLSLLGSHLVHMAERALGPVNEVEATGSTEATASFAPSGRTPALDTVTARLVLHGGTVLRLTLSNSATSPPLHEWRVRGDRGEAVLRNRTLDPVRGFELSIDSTGDVPMATPEASGVDDSRQPLVELLLDRFFGAVAASASTAPDFAAAASVQHVLGAIERSALSGEAVTVH